MSCYASLPADRLESRSSSGRPRGTCGSRVMEQVASSACSVASPARSRSAPTRAVVWRWGPTSVGCTSSSPRPWAAFPVRARDPFACPVRPACGWSTWRPDRSTGLGGCCSRSSAPTAGAASSARASSACSTGASASAGEPSPTAARRASCPSPIRSASGWSAPMAGPRGASARAGCARSSGSSSACWGSGPVWRGPTAGWPSSRRVRCSSWTRGAAAAPGRGASSSSSRRRRARALGCRARRWVQLPTVMPYLRMRRHRVVRLTPSSRAASSSWPGLRWTARSTSSCSRSPSWSAIAWDEEVSAEKFV